MSRGTNIQFIAPFSTLSASKEANICGPCQWSPLPSASVGFVQQEGMEGHHMVSTEQGRGISSSICLCPSMDVHSSWTSVFSCKCSLQYLVILPSHSCYSLLTIIRGCFTVHYWVFLSLSHTFKKKIANSLNSPSLLHLRICCLFLARTPINTHSRKLNKQCAKFVLRSFKTLVMDTK